MAKDKAANKGEAMLLTVFFVICEFIVLSGMLSN
jgi:hypothetical protein